MANIAIGGRMSCVRLRRLGYVVRIKWRKKEKDLICGGEGQGKEVDALQGTKVRANESLETTSCEDFNSIPL